MTSCTRDSADETGQAVQELLASSCDLQASSSYPESKPQNTTNICRKRKSLQSRRTPLGDVDLEDQDKETVVLKRARKSRAEVEMKQNQEGTCEDEKSLSMTQSGHQDKECDFWRNTSAPDDLFPNLLPETVASDDIGEISGMVRHPEDLPTHTKLFTETVIFDVTCEFRGIQQLPEHLPSHTDLLHETAAFVEIGEFLGMA